VKLSIETSLITNYTETGLITARQQVLDAASCETWAAGSFPNQLSLAPAFSLKDWLLHLHLLRRSYWSLVVS
jgi:hypothetical protein